MRMFCYPVIVGFKIPQSHRLAFFATINKYRNDIGLVIFDVGNIAVIFVSVE